MTDHQADGRFCEGCGRQAPPDARFCGGCGRAIGRTAAPGEPGQARVASGGDAGTAAGPETELLRFGPVVVQGFGELLLCILTVGIVWVCLAVARRREKYRLTTERLELRSGLVAVTSRTIELFRVHDLELQQPLFLRMAGAGNLVVRSQDAAEPEIVLAAIPDVKHVHEVLRARVNAERRRQHVKVVEES